MHPNFLVLFRGFVIKIVTRVFYFKKYAFNKKKIIHIIKLKIIIDI